MYKVEYLSSALSDMSKIIEYISKELVNKKAAIRLSEKFVEAADRLCDFPYANPVYVPIRPLKEEYRKVVVDNYIMFYYVDENNKTITISRVFYAKRNYVDQIE